MTMARVSLWRARGKGGACDSTNTMGWSSRPRPSPNGTALGHFHVLAWSSHHNLLFVRRGGVITPPREGASPSSKQM